MVENETPSNIYRYIDRFGVKLNSGQKMMIANSEGTLLGEVVHKDKWIYRNLSENEQPCTISINPGENGGAVIGSDESDQDLFECTLQDEAGPSEKREIITPDEYYRIKNVEYLEAGFRARLLMVINQANIPLGILENAEGEMKYTNLEGKTSKVPEDKTVSIGRKKEGENHPPFAWRAEIKHPFNIHVSGLHVYARMLTSIKNMIEIQNRSKNGTWISIKGPEDGPFQTERLKI